MIIVNQDKQKKKDTKTSEVITSNLSTTLHTFKELYSYPINSDISLRTLTIPGIEKEAALFSIQSIVDDVTIEAAIIEPLLQNEAETVDIKTFITASDITVENNVQAIAQKINNGYVALFIDGEKDAYVIDCNKFEGRNIESSENEIVLKGPKETFVESSDINISLIRKNIRNENLTFEQMEVSKRGKDILYVGYIKDLTNEDLLKEVKNRIEKIDVDNVQNLAILEQYIEENSTSIFPSILYTERPDRTTTFLLNGHIILLMNNSSDSLILPITFWDLFHSVEDDYLRFINGTFIRFIRILALFITLFISSIYISVTRFHPEMIPPDLLLSIAATKAKVPFTPLIEIILMELAFELIREAGLRVPLPIGPTIGIVGALILGQAAVEANIVSPIVVIVVALSALSSFVIGDIGLNFAIRITRFFFIFSAFLLGFYGMVSVFIVCLFYLVSLTSFGVAYFLPVTPSYIAPTQDAVARKPITEFFFRPKYLRPKDDTKR